MGRQFLHPNHLRQTTGLVMPMVVPESPVANTRPPTRAKEPCEGPSVSSQRKIGTQSILAQLPRHTSAVSHRKLGVRTFARAPQCRSDTSDAIPTLPRDKALVLCHAEKLGLTRLWRTVSAAAREKSPLPRSRERVASEASRVRACERSAPDAWFPQANAPSSALRAPAAGEGTEFGRPSSPINPARRADSVVLATNDIPNLGFDKALGVPALRAPTMRRKTLRRSTPDVSLQL